MNSAIRLRSIPTRSLRQRYSALSTLSGRIGGSRNLEGVVSTRHLNFVRIHCPGNRRSIHSTVALWKEYPDHELLAMPALSPTMESGTIAEWALKEGDSFSAGSVLCSVETDKATMDFECQDDGILAKILREGPNAVDISIGEPICVVVEDEADVAAFADYVLEASVAAPASEPAEATAAAPAASAPVDRNVSDDFILLPSARFLSESKYVLDRHLFVCEVLC